MHMFGGISVSQKEQLNKGILSLASVSTMARPGHLPCCHLSLALQSSIFFLSAHSKEMERLIYRPLDPRCFKINKLKQN